MSQLFPSKRFGVQAKKSRPSSGQVINIDINNCVEPSVVNIISRCDSL